MTKSQSSEERIARCTAILEGPLPVAEGQKITEACPSQEGLMPMTPSERSVSYKGHVVKIKTTYEIAIDDKPFERHIGVGEDGQVHCDALPYVAYESALDLVCGYIDGYPDHLPEPSADHDCEEAN